MKIYNKPIKNPGLDIRVQISRLGYPDGMSGPGLPESNLRIIAAEEKVEKTNSEENKEESEDEEDEENVPSTSKAEKDKMVEGQQKKKVEIAKIKVKLNILRDDLENAIRDKDFLKAQDLQLDVDDLDSKLINLNEELALMIIPPSVEKRIKTKARTEASAPAETQQGM